MSCHAWSLLPSSGLAKCLNVPSLPRTVAQAAAPRVGAAAAALGSTLERRGRVLAHPPPQLSRTPSAVGDRGADVGDDVGGQPGVDVIDAATATSCVSFPVLLGAGRHETQGGADLR